MLVLLEPAMKKFRPPLKIIQTSVNLKKKFNTTHFKRNQKFRDIPQTFENNREVTNSSQSGKMFTI